MPKFAYDLTCTPEMFLEITGEEWGSKNKTPTLAGYIDDPNGAEATNAGDFHALHRMYRHVYKHIAVREAVALANSVDWLLLQRTQVASNGLPLLKDLLLTPRTSSALANVQLRALLQVDASDHNLYQAVMGVTRRNRRADDVYVCAWLISQPDLTFVGVSATDVAMDTWKSILDNLRRAIHGQMDAGATLGFGNTCQRSLLDMIASTKFGIFGSMAPAFPLMLEPHPFSENMQPVHGYRVQWVSGPGGIRNLVLVGTDRHTRNMLLVGRIRHVCEQLGVSPNRAKGIIALAHDCKVSLSVAIETVKSPLFAERLAVAARTDIDAIPPTSLSGLMFGHVGEGTTLSRRALTAQWVFTVALAHQLDLLTPYDEHDDDVPDDDVHEEQLLVDPVDYTADVDTGDVAEELPAPPDEIVAPLYVETPLRSDPAIKLVDELAYVETDPDLAKPVDPTAELTDI